MNSLLDLAAHPVIGHRGASGLAPENTLESLQLALSQGADALEFDVHLSADGIPVLMHDATLDRTTGASGPVRAMTAKRLAAVDAGYRFSLDGGKTFPWRDRGVAVPSLARILEQLPTTPLLIELKTVEVSEPARRVLLEHSAAERVVLASFLDPALAPFRDGSFQAGASRKDILTLWLRSKLGLRAPARTLRAYAVPDRYRDKVLVPTARFVQAARAAGRPVHVWTVNTRERAAYLWRQGVCGIITNYPGLIRTERDRMFPSEALG